MRYLYDIIWTFLVNWRNWIIYIRDTNNSFHSCSWKGGYIFSYLLFMKNLLHASFSTDTVYMRETVDTEYTYYSWCMTSTDIVKWRKTNDYANFEEGMINMKILKKKGGRRKRNPCPMRLWEKQQIQIYTSSLCFDPIGNRAHDILLLKRRYLIYCAPRWFEHIQ